ncbi:translation initiation factor IF-3 [Maritalea mobilis]|uniref:Translation initiation factor IF-3 n=1 Tax=Maritalea mobilis TaxID=483324 RepID=A0A4R6VQG3_9HYPH|nr:translation initiation factor IF-3 [Maritalea mobilis]
MSKEGIDTIRRPQRPVQPQKDGPRSNREINVPEVQLIDAEGENRGVVNTREAMSMAQEAGLDLVEISPNAKPPVCKILDLGKYKYQAQKKAAEARKKQKVIDVKEIKMRPNTDTHDFEVKMRNIVKFLEGGDKVKVTMRFRGREMAHQELGLELLKKVQERVGEISKVEAKPKTEGRQMIMILAPTATK